MSTRFTTSYMDDAVFDLPALVNRAEEAIKDGDIAFDTLVGTGMSGAILVPWLADRLGVGFVIVRKDNDDSHHQSSRLMGTLGERWLFVDDMTCSGKTRNRVIERIHRAALRKEQVEQNYYSYGGMLEPIRTTHVGDYFYRYGVVSPTTYTHHPYCDGMPYNRTECPLAWDGSHM